MKAVLLALLALSAQAADIPFDVQKPTLLSPDSVYVFGITPKPSTKKVTIRLHTEKDGSLTSPEGKPYSPISRITATTSEGKVAELPFSPTDFGVPHTDIEDYDCDGDLDFRIINGWGTGGSWYSYFRFNGLTYEPWPEPEDLGLNGSISDGEIAASGKSGPEHSSTYYRVKGGKFQKTRVESIMLRRSLPEFKDFTDDDFVTAEVNETWKDGKLIKRIVTPQYGN